MVRAAYPREPLPACAALLWWVGEVTASVSLEAEGTRSAGVRTSPRTCGRTGEGISQIPDVLRPQAACRADWNDSDQGRAGRFRFLVRFLS